MPPLLCPSPNIVDQTFPRSVAELRLVRRALSTIFDLIQEEKCLLILSTTLRNFILELESTFDWSRMADYPQIQVIYSLLSQLGLQQHGVQVIETSHISDFQPHPRPTGSGSGPGDLGWSEEVGRFLALHSASCSPGKFFIGVACTFAFAGESLGTYDNPEGLPTFPLVSPDGIDGLEDAMEWELPDDLHRREIKFDHAQSNIKLLGGTVVPPSGSSHYQVRFSGARTWPLDKNLSVIPDDFLRELVPITGFALGVIKYVLLFGYWPGRRSRI